VRALTGIFNVSDNIVVTAVNLSGRAAAAASPFSLFPFFTFCRQQRKCTSMLAPGGKLLMLLDKNGACIFRMLAP
jgi:hypothetical protein